MTQVLGWGWKPGDRYTEADVVFHVSPDGSRHRLSRATDLAVLREAEAKAEAMLASGKVSAPQQEAFLDFVRSLIALHAAFKSRRVAA